MAWVSWFPGWILLVQNLLKKCACYIPVRNIMGETSAAEYQPLHGPVASGQFRSQIFDPLLILSQITAVQGIYYASSAALLVVGSRSIGFPLSLRFMFDPELVTLQSPPGRWLVLMYFLNALAVAFSMQLLIRRSRLCLDFVATCVCLHLVASCIFCMRFPVSASWWAVQLMAGILATLLGEWLCFRVEMQAIPVIQSMKTDVWSKWIHLYGQHFHITCWGGGCIPGVITLINGSKFLLIWYRFLVLWWGSFVKQFLSFLIELRPAALVCPFVFWDFVETNVQMFSCTFCSCIIKRVILNSIYAASFALFAKSIKFPKKFCRSGCINELPVTVASLNYVAVFAVFVLETCSVSEYHGWR